MNARVTCPVPPRDEALPQLGQLLDPVAMAPFLAHTLDRDGLGAVDIPYVHYRPRRVLDVHYVVEVDGTPRHAAGLASARNDLRALAALPEHQDRARLVGGRSPAAKPLAYDLELGALIQWLPFDLELPALAETPSSLRQRLEEVGVGLAPDGGEPVLLQYRPRRRAALRLDGHVVKIYGLESDFAAGVSGLDAAARFGSIRTARGAGVLPEWQLTVQEWLPGTSPMSRAAAARNAGGLLAELHGAELGNLRIVRPAQRLEKAAAAVKLVSAVAPSLAPRAAALLRELEFRAPEVRDLVASHGDFHGGQLLELGDGYAIIDFDLLCAAPPALDLANYAGHLVAQESLEVAAAAVVLDDLVEGYGRRPTALSWYLSAALLWFTRGPFKRFEDSWPERMERTLGVAEDALRL